MAAAVELISEQGLARTTAAEIGERAGFSREMVRTRFGSKNQLIDAMLRGQFEDHLLEPAGADEPGLDHWLGRLDILRKLAAEDPGLVRASFVLSFEGAGHGSWLRTRTVDWLRRAEQAVAGFVRVGQHDGSIDPAVDPHEVAQQFMTEAVGHAFRWVCSPDDFDFDAAVRRWRDATRTRYAAGTDTI